MFFKKDRGIPKPKARNIVIELPDCTRLKSSPDCSDKHSGS